MTLHRPIILILGGADQNLNRIEGALSYFAPN